MLTPDGVKVYETKRSVYWIDSDGIVCSYTKPHPPRQNAEEAVHEFEELVKNIGPGKHCFLIDAEHVTPNTKAERERSAELLPQIAKALAVIVHNALGRMLVNLFVGLQRPPYPLKIFKPGEEEKAREWLKQYM